MKKVYNIIKMILSIIQIVFILPALILENLSQKKMGVIRYLMFKKEQFSKGIFNENNLILYTYVLLLFTIIAIIILILNMKKKIKYKINIFIILLLNIALYLFINYEGAPQLEAYYFFLIEIFIIMIIEYVKFIINIFMYK
ncbi:hypothetical protein [Clostridium sp. Marseille-Q2269]|uniref:hypothetical protein n=1 Tax=Clostridium sp. Marseille-Q2269 TaxID=2942205 RepID=UPI0020743027|nr:hypothetical protein [Clostridium sp. Marseille-Q2269]